MVTWCLIEVYRALNRMSWRTKSRRSGKRGRGKERNGAVKFESVERGVLHSSLSKGVLGLQLV